jgi:tetratricopeptide (TPR) repeat protein
MYKRAFQLDCKDARLLYEWDQLKKRSGLDSPEDRLRCLDEHRDLVARRDDLTVEYITLLNHGGQWQTALEQLSKRRFSPWEGGEGLVSAQYVHAHFALGKAALAAGEAAEALQHFETARHYPQNLGEGKHLLTLERHLDYFSALAAEQSGDPKLAHGYLEAAAAELPEPGIHSYFQALALRALANHKAADEVLSNLAEFASQKMKSEPRIDYFATSLPDLLLFDDDLGKRNRIEALLLSGLASHGRGDLKNAIRQLEQVLDEDANHLVAAELLVWIKGESKAIEEMPKVQAGLAPIFDTTG